MTEYINKRLKRLNNIISKNKDEKVKALKMKEVHQLEKCKKCEWGRDTGLNIYCPKIKCVK